MRPVDPSASVRWSALRTTTAHSSAQAPTQLGAELVRVGCGGEALDLGGEGLPVGLGVLHAGKATRCAGLFERRRIRYARRRHDGASSAACTAAASRSHRWRTPCSPRIFVTTLPAQPTARSTG